MQQDTDQPYRPPQSSQDAAAVLKRTSVVLAVLLQFVTGGLYLPYWFLSRRKALKDFEQIPQWAGIVFLLWALGLIVLQVVMAGAPSESATPLLLVYQLLGAILGLFLAFRTRSILEGIFRNDVSGILTFFFSAFYLQYKINRAEEDAPQEGTLGLSPSRR